MIDPTVGTAHHLMDADGFHISAKAATRLDSPWYEKHPTKYRLTPIMIRCDAVKAIAKITLKLLNHCDAHQKIRRKNDFAVTISM